jgi:hypothetical protein
LAFVLLLSRRLVAVPQLLPSSPLSALGAIDAKKFAQVDPAYLLLEMAELEVAINDLSSTLLAHPLSGCCKLSRGSLTHVWYSTTYIGHKSCICCLALVFILRLSTIMLFKMGWDWLVSSLHEPLAMRWRT